MISFKGGKGCYLFGNDGRKYFDFTNPRNILGYADDDINAAVSNIIRAGAYIPSQSDDDSLREKMKLLFPFCKSIQFFYNYQEPLDLVRNLQGFVVWANPAKYNKSDLVNEKNICFIETDNFARFPTLTFSSYVGVAPRYMLISGALANGFPLFALLSSEDDLGDPKQTFNRLGNCLGVAAALKTIELLRSRYDVSDLFKRGQDWTSEFNSIWPAMIKIEGHPTLGEFVGDPAALRDFFKESLECGIYFGQKWYFNFPLADKSKITLDLCRDILCKMKLRKAKK